jgi:hypothetical protein
MSDAPDFGRVVQIQPYRYSGDDYAGLRVRLVPLRRNGLHVTDGRVIIALKGRPSTPTRCEGRSEAEDAIRAVDQARIDRF